MAHLKIIFVSPLPKAYLGIKTPTQLIKTVSVKAFFRLFFHYYYLV